jgi:hypothetical protein
MYSICRHLTLEQETARHRLVVDSERGGSNSPRQPLPPFLSSSQRFDNDNYVGLLC